MKEVKFKIGNKLAGDNYPVFIIAEAGVNHNGRLDLALELVDAAAEAGADAVKFQTFKAEQVVVKAGKMANYQKRNIGKSESQLKMLKKLELRERFYKPIIARCKKKKIIFLSTPHGGLESVNYLHKLKVPAFKFGSGDLTNLPLLECAAKFRKPIILGTGMATMNEVKKAINYIKKTGNKKIIALHCTTNYPCPLEEVNLRAMRTMMKDLNVLVGYSDHTLGSQVPVMAVAFGARVIEKHFTLNKKMKGPDHIASAEPKELKEMIRQIRSVETILGSAKKKPNKSEIPMMKTIRKSIVAARDIKRGGRFLRTNLTIKRPGTGIAPENLFKLLGKKSRKNIKVDTLIKKNDYA